MDLVLILTHSGDRAVDLVTPHLTKRGIDFIRFNTEEFPQYVQMSLDLRGENWNGTITFPERKVHVNDITSIWNRRPHESIIDPAVSNPVLRKWGAKESTGSLRILWSLLGDTFWLNPIDAGERIQNNKWIQMMEASKLGFRTPDHSMISSDLETIKEFCQKSEGDIVIKKIVSGILEYPDGRTGVLFTNRIQPRNLTTEDFKGIRFVPVFMQTCVTKKLELRVIVVGNQVFSCALYSQEHAETRSDWRTQIFLDQGVRHEPYQLPEEVEQKCIELVRKLGLHYGAIDLAVTPEGEYIFFEINQNGEWAWIELRTGMPIGKAIADILITPNGQ